ncbi:MAG: hypothetical protein ACJAYU_003406 [Bradymonadia bacterium]|jgi:hypothetical protein
MRRNSLSALLVTSVLLSGCARGGSDQTEGEAQPPAEEVEEGSDGDLTLGAAFDGAELTGMAGGPQDARDFGPGCVGFIPEGEVGNHRFIVGEDQALTLVAAPQGLGVMDLMMAIRLPDGSWTCADDSNNLNPNIARMFMAGEYNVFIGTHSDATAPYQLTIRAGIYTPDPLVLGGRFPAAITDGEPAERTADGTYGGLRFGANSAHAVLTGQAGGSRAASDLSPGCSGWIAQVPDHILDLTDQTDLMFRVRSATDTTLFIEGPRGLKSCADDEDGLNPVIRGTMLPGRYRIYVGTYEELENTGEYTLGISR